MREELLHFIWKYQLFDSSDLITDEGEPIQIIQQGFLNHDAGPDFSDSRIKIGDTTWAGNIEIHINSSDWFKHKHHADSAYKNVILHVVYANDADFSDEIHCPTLSLSNRIDISLLDHYNSLMRSKSWIACLSQIHQVDSIIKSSWQNRLLVLRLEKRYLQILHILDNSGNDWQQAFFVHIARSFGFKVNADAFENLANNTPLKLFGWHKDNQLQIEAILFGQSGLLPEQATDHYTLELIKEYSFLKSKYQLKPIPKVMWKYLRMRPSNFPTIRISQLSNLLAKSSALFSKIIEVKNIKELNNLFQVEASYYWSDHFQFNQTSKRISRKKLGESSINIILINTVIPFMFAYGKEKQLDDLVDRSIDFIEQLKPEQNNITTKMSDLGFDNKHAAHSQALIELYTNYCNNKDCLNCSIGTSLLRK